MRNNIINLINSGITAHKVAVDTGLPRNTVYRIFRGETKLSKVEFGTIEILDKYWEDNKMIRIKRTEVLTDSSLKFFALPQNAEAFNKYFSEEKTRKLEMLIDEDFYKALLENPVIIDGNFVKDYADGALDGITPYKYEHVSTMNNITEHESYSKIDGCDTADYVASKKLKEQFRTQSL